MSGIVNRASRTAAIFAATALLAGGMSPAFAAGTDPDTAAPAAAAKAQEKGVKKSRIICVKSEITGSRVARETCKTRAQWIKEDGVDPLDMQAR